MTIIFFRLIEYYNWVIAKLRVEAWNTLSMSKKSDDSFKELKIHLLNLAAVSLRIFSHFSNVSMR